MKLSPELTLLLTIILGTLVPSEGLPASLPKLPPNGPAPTQQPPDTNPVAVTTWDPHRASTHKLLNTIIRKPKPISFSKPPIPTIAYVYKQGSADDAPYGCPGDWIEKVFQSRIKSLNLEPRQSGGGRPRRWYFTPETLLVGAVLPVLKSKYQIEGYICPPTSDSPQKIILPGMDSDFEIIPGQPPWTRITVKIQGLNVDIILGPQSDHPGLELGIKHGVDEKRLQ